MEITKVSCNGCGAPLEVAAGARFVTCRHCGAQLEIKQTASAVYTEVLARIDARTAGMAEDLGAIRLEQEIERLDREWALERNGFMTRDKQGNLHEPSTAGSAVGAIIAVVFGVLWTIGATAMMAAAPNMGPLPVFKVIFPMFGVAFVLGAIVMGVKGTTAAGQFQEAQERYRQKRTALMQRKTGDAGPAAGGSGAVDGGDGGQEHA